MHSCQGLEIKMREIDCHALPPFFISFFFYLFFLFFLFPLLAPLHFIVQNPEVWGML